MEKSDIINPYTKDKKASNVNIKLKEKNVRGSFCKYKISQQELFSMSFPRRWESRKGVSSRATDKECGDLMRLQLALKQPRNDDGSLDSRLRGNDIRNRKNEIRNGNCLKSGNSIEN
ncbi:MAG: hypothetical protein RCG15_02420 [Candidatus Rickettsia vulgarisii]